MAVICPFCGKTSQAEDHCTKCRTRFTKEVRAVAFTEENDPRSDRIGPVSTKTAKIIGWAVLALLLVAFVLATELTGNGVTGSGIR
ncbi:MULTISPECIES: hypothetical protein [Gordonibacter]|uniref:Zinc ribbon domain-containing protein n=1 Tax=Gordonibacter faecis TaxID=3047475 RepID=A0ABT7DLN8_9ACTN|nr:MULTISPECIES: hypothetical protein [unclassified Gordonibacter]MDJ1650455.1 hypothetical protein [Gordonibacter sp. KGMB12511]